MRKNVKIFISLLILAACGNYAEVAETAKISDISDISEFSEISESIEMAEIVETVEISETAETEETTEKSATNPNFLVKTALEKFISEQQIIFENLGFSQETILNNPLSAPLFNQFDENTWDFALIAAVDNEEIYIYSGLSADGVIVHYKGQSIFFENWLWTGRTYPQIKYFANIRQLVIILPAGSGTGVSLDNLYILSFDEIGNYQLAYLLGTAAHEQLDEDFLADLAENLGV